MGITRIRRLRNYAVFRDFTWPDDLPECGRYNLIYGWNGSGKTLLSRVFRALEKGMPPATGEVILSINGRDVTGNDFPQAGVPIRVFNRDFVNDSVFPVGGADIPPIYVIGKENVEKQREVERLKTILNGAQVRSGAARSKRQDAERALDKFCIDQAGVIKDTLRSPGPNRYNNYDKGGFWPDAQKMATAGDAPAHRVSESKREKLLAQHRSTPKQRVQELTYCLPPFQQLVDSVSELLSATVVSAVIQALKDDPVLSNWVREGLGFHRERSAGRCLFCEQALPPERLAVLEGHFNAQYEQFTKRLEQQISHLEAASKEAADLKLPNKAELYDDLAAEYGTTEQALRRTLDGTRESLNALVQALMEKKSRTFERVALEAPVLTVDDGVVHRLNEVIRKHNQACDDFESRVLAARDRLAADMIAKNLEEFVRLANEGKQGATAVRMAEQEIEELTTMIGQLQREIIQHSQPAEELNTDLHNYLGHAELQLEIKDTGYAITRDGLPVESVSEGETTAIALLYFLKSLEDREFDVRQGLVVLDDPVSSLDANALYCAFGFIRERTQHAGQLFILTHNCAFFRQVRNWFHHLRGQSKSDVRERPARFYMLECTCDGTDRCARIRPLDPLLEQYESEYHFLFARIHRAATASPEEFLEQNYLLPNIARRLLEAFLAFSGRARITDVISSGCRYRGIWNSNGFE